MTLKISDFIPQAMWKEDLTEEDREFFKTLTGCLNEMLEAQRKATEKMCVAIKIYLAAKKERKDVR
jgi:hypothetical protein